MSQKPISSRVHLSHISCHSLNLTADGGSAAALASIISVTKNQHRLGVRRNLDLFPP